MSSAFRASGAIPARFTCAGADESPPLAWTGVPVGTKRLVLIVDDPDAGHFTHWIAFSIAPASASLAEGVGTATSSLVQGTNDFGRVGYGGPCPPSGTHHYVFTLYALAGPLGLDGNPRAAVVRAALGRAEILGTATLIGTFRR
jgi:Raf kinase inhibitor-like YbhB/YbcL family protein